MNEHDKNVMAREDNATAEIRGTAETASAEKNVAATVPEKFGSVDALVAAYTNLEAEFTKRSQRLKELEERNKAHDMPERGAPSGGTAYDDGEFFKKALADARVREAVIGDYLKSLSENRGVPLITGGVSAAAPAVKPATVREAGKLAERFLKN